MIHNQYCLYIRFFYEYEILKYNMRKINKLHIPLFDPIQVIIIPIRIARRKNKTRISGPRIQNGHVFDPRRLSETKP